jgi:hypothetical protein
METTVVNIYKHEYDVYIGRKGKGGDGFFGNPIQVGKTCPICTSVHVGSGSTLSCYKEHLKYRMKTEPGFVEKLRALRGKKLACFCKPKPCHGDVMIKAIEWLWSEKGLARFPIQDDLPW